jgi:membrane fusion protein (multidrug efflux system)
MKSLVLSMPILCISLLVIVSCSNKGGQQESPPIPEVGVIKAQPQNLPLTKELVGRLSPYRSADVRARVAGVLLKRTYDEGTEVKKGQLLFQIDPTPLKAALDASLASLAQAQATYTNNKIAAQRARKLAPKGYVTQADLDNAEAAERTATAAVQVARANVQTARINLSYTNVVSPIDGRANKQQVTEGALVGDAEVTLLTTVDQIDPLYVNFTMSVTELEQMRRAQREGNVTLVSPNQAMVRLTLPDGSPYPKPGMVDFSASTVNPATGSVDLRALVPNPQYRLLPGTYVTLKVNLGELHKVFLIPQQAVQRDTSGAYVMIIGQDGKVARQNVTTSDMRNGYWVITGGLKMGDQVVVSGVQKVKEGAPAKAIPWQPTQNGGQASTSSQTARNSS